MQKGILERVYELYSREIFLYLFGIVKDFGTAEDLMQDAFVKAFLSLPDENQNVRAWLYKVARNLAFNYLERNRRLNLYDNTSTDFQKILERSHSSDIGNPVKEMLADEKHKILYEGLIKLELRKREVLTLQYFSGLNQKQVSKVLGISAENVRVISHRAKKELKNIMEEEGYEV